MQKQERYNRFLAYFSQNMPEADTELVFTSAFHLLISTILSAQCTDKRVNSITPALFRRYATPAAMAGASYDEVFAFIKSCSYPNSKAHYLVDMSRKLVSDFGGQVPEEADTLMTLPGVGRKTAHVAASVLFNKPVIAVDTHVFRVAARIGLTTRAKTPLETEKQLMRHIPAGKRRMAHHWLRLHGRYICKAREPLCSRCGLTGFCAFYKKNKP